MSNENKVKEKFLGSLKSPKVTGKNAVDPKKISMPMHDPEAVMRIFCTGCGKYSRINQKGATNLAQMANTELPSDTDGFYFEASRCILCDDDFREVKLKKTR